MSEPNDLADKRYGAIFPDPRSVDVAVGATFERDGTTWRRVPALFEGGPLGALEHLDVRTDKTFPIPYRFEVVFGPGTKGWYVMTEPAFPIGVPAFDRFAGWDFSGPLIYRWTDEQPDAGAVRGAVNDPEPGAQ